MASLIGHERLGLLSDREVQRILQEDTLEEPTNGGITLSQEEVEALADLLGPVRFRYPQCDSDGDDPTGWIKCVLALVAQEQTEDVSEEEGTQ